MTSGLESVPPVHSASTDHGPGFPGYLAASGGNQVRRVCRSSLKAGSRQSSKAMEAARALNRADEDTFLFRRSACCKAFFGSSGFELRADQEPCSSSHSRSDPKPRFHPSAWATFPDGAQTHASSSGAITIAFERPVQPLRPRTPSSSLWTSPGASRLLHPSWSKTTSAYRYLRINGRRNSAALVRQPGSDSGCRRTSNDTARIPRSARRWRSSVSTEAAMCLSAARTMRSRDSTPGLTRALPRQRRHSSSEIPASPSARDVPGPG